jgi:hypothetical protein
MMISSSVRCQSRRMSQAAKLIVTYLQEIVEALEAGDGQRIKLGYLYKWFTAAHSLFTRRSLGQRLFLIS